MVLRRLEALYKPIGEGQSKGLVSICQANKDLYPENFLSMEGIPELVNLYRVYNIEGEERNNIRMKQEITLLQEKIKEYFRGKYAAENNRKNKNNNKIINKLIQKSIDPKTK